MWSFGKKKPRSIEELSEIGDDWSVSAGEYGGSPLIVRRNESAKQWTGCPSLSIKLGFAIPLNDPVPGELPMPQENEQLASVEETISAKVLSFTRGIQVLTLTTGKMKEIVFYIEDGSQIEKLHKQLQKEITSHEVQCMAEVDKDWKTYHQFASGS